MASAATDIVPNMDSMGHADLMTTDATSRSSPSVPKADRSDRLNAYFGQAHPAT
jgi:hypothetical protein